jgi:arylsulfatase A
MMLNHKILAIVLITACFTSAHAATFISGTTGNGDFEAGNDGSWQTGFQVEELKVLQRGDLSGNWLGAVGKTSDNLSKGMAQALGNVLQADEPVITLGFDALAAASWEAHETLNAHLFTVSETATNTLWSTSFYGVANGSSRTNGISLTSGELDLTGHLGNTLWIEFYSANADAKSTILVDNISLITSPADVEPEWAELIVEAAEPDQGTINPIGTNTFALNAIVEVEAQPYAGYAFAGWTGDLVSTNNPLTLTMASNITLTATFEVVPRTKNIILIMADDIAYDNYSCYGSEYFSTPNLDALAAGGTRFTRCYATPVCTPSRVRLMTGRDASHPGNYSGFKQLSPSEKTFVEPLKAAGYASAIAGKWQLDDDGSAGTAPEDTGFDTWLLNNTALTEARNYKMRYWDTEAPVSQTVLLEDDNLQLMNTTTNDYGPDKCCDFLIDFITQNTNREFFVYYPMILVHDPFKPTPDSPDRFESDIHTNYQDMVAYMDKLVGRLVDTLDELGLREDTIILYTGDNGTGRDLTYPFADETRPGRKGFTDDGGHHVALIANCPGTVVSNTVCDDLIDFTDFYPTLCEIAGAPMPTDRVMDGRSFLPQLVGDAGNPKRIIYQTYYPYSDTIRNAYGGIAKGIPILWAHTKTYKLYQPVGNIGEENRFFNIANDRDELNPITWNAATAAEQAIWQELQSVLNTLPKTRQGVAYTGWQDRYFSDEQIGSGIAAPAEDPDGDGKTNEHEFIMVTPPLEPGGASLMTAGTAKSGDFPRLRFTRRIDLDAIYSVEQAASLESGSWINIDSDVVLLGKTNNGDGTETVVYEVQRPLGSGPAFFRVQAAY